MLKKCARGIPFHIWSISPELLKKLHFLLFGVRHLGGGQICALLVTFAHPKTHGFHGLGVRNFLALAGKEMEKNWFGNFQDPKFQILGFSSSNFAVFLKFRIPKF